MSMSCKRRTRIVDGRIQGELLRRVCMHWALFLILSISLTVGLNILTSDPAIPLGNQIVDSIAVNFWPFLTVLALLPFFLVDTVRLSSNFAGPMVRLRRALEGLGTKADSKPLVFRDGDFWIGTAEAYNQVAERFAAMQERIEVLEQALEEKSDRCRPTMAPLVGVESSESQCVSCS
jgi:hypothetical protein